MKLYLLSIQVLSCGFLVASPITEKEVVDSKKEQAISKAYDLYISAVSKVTLQKTEFKLPSSMVSAESEEYYIIEHAYYISPNEQRGFSLAIPKKLARKNGKLLEISVDLKMKEQTTRQGIQVITLESA